jgi:choice-of-anchor B domain-containing protein
MRTLSFFTFFFLIQILSAQINENIELIYEYNRGEPRYSGSWFYADEFGEEYALIGAYGGTAIYHLQQNEAVELAYIPGPNSNWREITVLNNHAYVVTEGQGPGEGMQVIDLNNLPDTAVLVNTIDTYFNKAHIIQKDIFTETPYIFVCGANSASGVYIFDCSTPQSPVLIGTYDEGLYVHDVHIRDTLMFTAAIYDDVIDIVSIADPTSPVILSGFDDPGTFTHSFSSSPDLKYLFLADEKDGYPMRTFNIEDIYDPEEVNTYSANLTSLVHNPYTNGIFTVVSHNTEGLRILDTRDPELLFEVGYYDTYEGDSGGFNGLWSACPYLPSGRIIGADRTRGLMVWEFNNTEAARIYGTIIDSETQEIIENATLYIQDPDTLLTSEGIFKWVNKGGSFNATIEAPNYQSITTEIIMEEGDSTTLTFELNKTVNTIDISSSKANIYPNPIINRPVNIELNSRCKHVEITTIDGKTKRQIEANGTNSMELNLSKGVYIITLKDNSFQTILARKIIVEN